MRSLKLQGYAACFNKAVSPSSCSPCSQVIPANKLDRLMNAITSGSFFLLQSAVMDTVMDGYSAGLVSELANATLVFHINLIHIFLRF